MGQKPPTYSKFKNESPLPVSSPPAPSPAPPLLPFPNNNPYGYRGVPDPRLTNIYQNSQNTINKIYISRSCMGSFLKREFSPSVTGDRLAQNEFEMELTSIEGIVSGFRTIKCLYFWIFFTWVVGVGLGLTSMALDPGLKDNSTTGKEEKREKSESQGVYLAAVLVLMVFNCVFFMAIVCALKKFEFAIADYCNTINKQKYLLRNLYWKVGGFCRYIEIEMLPLNVEQIWFLQTEEGKKAGVENVLLKMNTKKK